MNSKEKEAHWIAIQEALSPKEQVIKPFNDLAPQWHKNPFLDDWKVPKNQQETEDLLNELHPRQSVICASIAAEMVLSYWNIYAKEQNLSASDRLGPKVLLRNLQRWIANDFRLTDLGDSIEVVYNIVGNLQRQYTGSAYLESFFDDPYSGVERNQVWRSGNLWEISSEVCSSEVWTLLTIMFAGMSALRAKEKSEKDKRSRIWASKGTPAQIASATISAALQINEPHRDYFNHHIQPTEARLSSRKENYLAWWWQRCTARLAIRDAATAWIS